MDVVILQWEREHICVHIGDCETLLINFWAQKNLKIYSFIIITLFINE